MIPQEYINEVDYYDKILIQYEKTKDTGMTEDAELFSTGEIINIMKDLKDASRKTLQERKNVENIAKNTLVLLVSLFAQKDETVQYQEFDTLTEDEKRRLKTELKPILEIEN